MSVNVREALVIVDAGSGTVADDARLPGLRVVHRLPPRLAVIEVPEGSAPVVADARVFTDTVPENVLAQLGSAERAFASAWARADDKTARRGEGLSWDAPGFVPPDIPDR